MQQLLYNQALAIVGLAITYSLAITTKVFIGKLLATRRV